MDQIEMFSKSFLLITFILGTHLIPFSCPLKMISYQIGSTVFPLDFEILKWFSLIAAGFHTTF